jgi:archaellum biogenesis ATPase FlaH
LIDFDAEPGRDIETIFHNWRTMLDERSPGLFEELLIQRTRGKGFHVLYRCPDAEIPGNQKLTRFVNGSGEPRVLIETRGEGGQFLAWPSPGYRIMAGDLRNPPVVTPEEREAMIECARALNEYVEPCRVVGGPGVPKKQDARQSGTTGKSPGDDFNERGDLPGLLAKHGWQPVRGNGSSQYYRRPGKDRGGHSASLIDGKTFYVFSSNAHPFEPDQGYSPFGVYALLEHNGDYSRAAKELARHGYGERQGPAKEVARQESGEEKPKQQQSRIKRARLMNLDELGECFEREVSYLYRSHIPNAMPIIINGREGEGKTTICVQIGSEILANGADHEVIIWVASEGFVSDTTAKMVKLGVDRRRFLVIQNANETHQFNFSLGYDRKQLDEALSECRDGGRRVLAVFIDSIRGIAPFDDNDSRIKNVLMDVNAIVCDKHKASLIYIDHFKKGEAKTLLDRSVGTTAKTAAVRRVFSVIPVSTFIRKIVIAKSNILGDMPPELMAALANDRLVICEATEKVEATVISQAEKWLIEMFSKKETYKVTDVYEAGEKAGFNVEVLRKAKQHLGVDVWNSGRGSAWYWTCKTFLSEDQGDLFQTPRTAEASISRKMVK